MTTIFRVVAVDWGSITRQIDLCVVLDLEVVIRVGSLCVSIHVPQGLDRRGGGQVRLFRKRFEGRGYVNGAVRAIAQRRDVLVQILDQQIQTTGGASLRDLIAAGVALTVASSRRARYSLRSIP